MTASSIACTPLFLNAVPHSIGTISLLIVRSAQALLDLLDRQLVRLEVLVHQLFVGLGGGLDHLARAIPCASARSSAGISLRSNFMPWEASSQ